ncbi:MAG: S41 family peptidase [bacterium]
MKNKIKHIILNKNFLFGVISVVLLSGVFLGGMYFEYTHRPYSDRISGISNMQSPDNSVDMEPFWQVWNTIDQKFPGAKNISSQDRMYGAIKGLVGSLGDPYSVYFPPQDSKDFSDTINGSFEGIGMEIGIKDGAMNVIAPLKNTPAEKAGLKSGDIILKINASSTSDMSVDQAVHIIRGPKGTPVTLNIYRAGEKQARDITVIRDVIEVPMIDSKDLGNGVFKISLYTFGADSDRQFANAINEFLKSGDTKLIIDLRGDPGGFLDSAINIASMFLPKGDVIVTESFGGNQKDEISRSKGYGFVDPSKVKIVILVDGGSASASEILSGALQQHGVAKLIGEQTYGKGSVQDVTSVTNNTTLKLTIAKWLTPDGTWISKKGLTPDIVVKLPDTVTTTDLVLNRALQYFKDGK